MIKVENLSRKYGDFLAVDDVSFTIESGEIVGLLGHNGAGKTTIMKVLTGYLEQSTGAVGIDNLDIDTDLDKIKELIGYLPENIPLYSEMTIVEYLEYVADLRSIETSQKASAIKRAIARTNLQEKANDKIQTLSKGYKQRVGVAQAILHEPKILILDEPTNGLDPQQISEMRALIKELAKDSTVILSTHIMQEVEAVCDRVLILQRGKLVLDSTLLEIQSSGGIVLTVNAGEAEASQRLAAIRGVSKIELMSKQDELNTFLITPNDESHPYLLPNIAEEVIAAEWKLYALNPQNQSLESIFTNLSVA